MGERTGGPFLITRDDIEIQAEFTQPLNNFLCFGSHRGPQLNRTNQLIIHRHHNQRVALGLTGIRQGLHLCRQGNPLHRHEPSAADADEGVIG